MPDKRCSSCHETKTKDLFYRDRRRRDGLTVYCRACIRKKNPSKTGLPRGMPAESRKNLTYRIAKGAIAWNAGTVGVMKPNANSFRVGDHPSERTEFKPGYTPYNKGTKRPELSGKNHHNWKGGVSGTRRLERARSRFVVREAMIRDYFTCQQCGAKSIPLHADHIKLWSEFPHLRFEITNLQTLCVPCHYKKTFGREMLVGNSWCGYTRRV